MVSRLCQEIREGGAGRWPLREPRLSGLADLVRIEWERATEPDRIRKVYVVQARRIEPVGLVYLWPVTN
jgi:hypothetical protein